ncbi:MAG: hypothetical protein AAGI23_12720 [Bacteroidota bacterium]
MKNILMMLGCVAFLASASAQQPTTTKSTQKVSTISNVESEQATKDFERYMSSLLKMEYRNATINALGLTNEEVEEFDPIFKDYVEKKQDMMRKKMRMFKDFQEEMDEDDSPENIEEDKADFIEDYLEFTADEIEMRKRYFDRLEDKISVEKALQFITMEEMAENRIQRETIIRMVPFIIVEEDMSDEMKSEYDKFRNPSYNDNMKDSKKGQSYNSTNDDDSTLDDTRTYNAVTNGTRYNQRVDVDGSTRNNGKATAVSNADAVGQAKSKIDEFRSWVMSNKGEASLSHDYTYNGIEALLGVIESIDQTMDNNISVSNMKSEVMDIASKLKVDKYGDEHADVAYDAFTYIARMMNNVTGSNDMALMNAAKKIDKDVLLLDQAKHIYNFFETANQQLQSIKL